MSHVTPEELDRSLRRVKKYVDDNIGSGSGSGGTSIDVDDTLSDTSENPVQNKVIKSALDGKANMSDIPDVSGFALASDIPDVSGFASLSDIPDVSGFVTSDALSGKQDKLTFDSSPTENSLNPVTSGGVYTAIDNIESYELPAASQTILGGIKVGAGLKIDADGVLYVDGANKAAGYLTLSNTSIMLDPDNTSVEVTITSKSAPVSAVSSNAALARVSVSGDTITVFVGEGKGTCNITVTTQETGLYTSVSKTIAVTVNNLVIVSWADGTDAQIKSMLDAHYAGDIDIHDYWSVGDVRDVQLSAIASNTYVSESQPAQTIQMRLVNSGGRTLSDTNSECAFIVESSFLSRSGVMNKTNVYTNGWSSRGRRSWCNDSFKNALPELFRECFKSFINEYGSIAGNTIGNTSPSYTKTGDANDFFAIPSYREVFATSNRWSYYYSTKKPGNSYWLRDIVTFNSTLGVVAGSNGLISNDTRTSWDKFNLISPFGVI